MQTPLILGTETAAAVDFLQLFPSVPVKLHACANRASVASGSRAERLARRVSSPSTVLPFRGGASRVTQSHASSARWTCGGPWTIASLHPPVADAGAPAGVRRASAGPRLDRGPAPRHALAAPRCLRHGLEEERPCDRSAAPAGAGQAPRGHPLQQLRPRGP
jgi:hypothetical protein